MCSDGHAILFGSVVGRCAGLLVIGFIKGFAILTGHNSDIVQPALIFFEVILAFLASS
jgi:hypothetical protein